MECLLHDYEAILAQLSLKKPNCRYWPAGPPACLAGLDVGRRRPFRSSPVLGPPGSDRPSWGDLEPSRNLSTRLRLCSLLVAVQPGGMAVKVSTPALAL